MAMSSSASVDTIWNDNDSQPSSSLAPTAAVCWIRSSHSSTLLESLIVSTNVFVISESEPLRINLGESVREKLFYEPNFCGNSGFALPFLRIRQLHVRLPDLLRPRCSLVDQGEELARLGVVVELLPVDLPDEIELLLGDGSPLLLANVHGALLRRRLCTFG